MLLACVVGATPTSYWVGRGVYGVDLTTVGSGNLGATNTYRVLGCRAALPVMLIDVAKGWFPTFVFPMIATDATWTWRKNRSYDDGETWIEGEGYIEARRASTD